MRRYDSAACPQRRSSKLNLRRIDGPYLQRMPQASGRSVVSDRDGLRSTNRDLAPIHDKKYLQLHTMNGPNVLPHESTAPIFL